MKRLAVFTLGCLILSAGVAQAEDTVGYLTGNDMLKPCQAYVQEDYSSLMPGVCLRAVLGLSYPSPTICLARGVTQAQAVRVVVRYIEQRPGRMHENFLRLANEALTEAWPCRR